MAAKRRPFDYRTDTAVPRVRADRVDASGVAKLKEVLAKYEEILKLLK